MTNRRQPDVFALITEISPGFWVLTVYVRFKYEKHLRMVERSYHSTLKAARNESLAIAPEVEPIVVDNNL